jgi:hypothetical protein
MPVIGEDVINLTRTEGVLSCEAGIGHEARPVVAKANTAIKANAVLMTPIATGHADFGLVVPMTATPDFAIFYIAGIATEAIAASAGNKKTSAWITGGFKREAIADEATILTADNIRRMRDVMLIVTDKSVQGN